MKNKIFDFKFIKTFLALSLPMAMQNLITSSVNLIDSLMIGQLGAVSIAAVGLANKVFFVFSIMIFGMCGGSAAFLTQFLGKRDEKGIKKVIFLNFVIAVTFAFLAFITACFFPEALMRLLSDDENVIKEGARYLHNVSFSYVPTAVSFVLSYALKSLEHPKIPLISSISSIAFNTFFNYAFIFGKFGFPAMGVAGAAFGTIIARTSEVIIISLLTVKKLPYLKERFSEYMEINRVFLKKFFTLVVPVTLNETIWSLGTSVLAGIFARVSTEAVAAVNIINILYEASSVLIFGMGHAAGVLVGKAIGERKPEDAYLYTRRFCIYIPLIAIACALVIRPAVPLFLSLFKIDPQTKSAAMHLAVIMLIFIPLRSYNHLNIVGTLRSGGDAVFCFFADISALWLFAIPMSFTAGIILRSTIEITYFVSQLEEVIKAFIIFIRLRKNNWIKDLVN